jgi:hypothetical protein
VPAVWEPDTSFLNSKWFTQLEPITCLSFRVEIDFATLNGTVSRKIARSFLCDRLEAGD